MAEAVTKLAVKTEKPEEKQGRSVATTTAESWPFAGLRREIDRLFDDFAWGSWRSPFRRPRRPLFDVEPFWRGEVAWGKAPAVDIADTAKAYEITAELPRMDEKNVEVKFSDGTLIIWHMYDTVKGSDWLGDQGWRAAPRAVPPLNPAKTG
jgi:HSP20 family protein